MPGAGSDGSPTIEQVGVTGSEGVLVDDISGSNGGAGFLETADRSVVGQDSHRLLESFHILHRQKDDHGAAVTRDRDPLMGAGDPLYDL